MTQITSKGRKLSNKIAPSIGVSGDILRACSLIARHATTHHRLMEAHCNGHPLQGDPRIPWERMHKLQAKFEKWLDKREVQIESRIRELVNSLPPTDKGPLTVSFTGDPRGITVTLLCPDGRYDNWSRDGFCVPQDHD